MLDIEKYLFLILIRSVTIIINHNDHCIQMLYYKQIYVSEGININKTNHLFECKIDHYRYSFKIQFTCQIDICEC